MLESLSQKVLGLVCAELGWSVFSSVTTRRNLGTDRGDTTDTNFTQWTDNTNCPTVHIMHKFTGGPSGLQQTQAPTTIKTLHHWAFSCSSFFKLHSCWWKRQIDVITSTWTHWTNGSPHCLTWQFRKCVCFWQLLCRYGTIRGTCWKIICQHWNSTSWPFMETLWNETDSITYLDFYMWVTIKMKLTRQT